MLRKKLFQEEWKNDDRWERKEGDGEEVVTIGQVRETFKNMGGMKASGKDEIIVKAIRETTESVGERIRETFQTAMNNNRHPEWWKTAITAIIPKPGKADYSNPGSDRPVSLLNTLGKGLEKIIVDRIRKEAEGNEKEGFHQHQWGGRRGRGAEECVVTTLAWAEKRKREGKRVVLIMTDVAQAFPLVAKGRLANRLETMGMSKEIAG